MKSKGPNSSLVSTRFPDQVRQHYFYGNSKIKRAIHSQFRWKAKTDRGTGPVIPFIMFNQPLIEDSDWAKPTTNTVGVFIAASILGSEWLSATTMFFHGCIVLKLGQSNADILLVFLM